MEHGGSALLSAPKGIKEGNPNGCCVPCLDCVCQISVCPKEELTRHLTILSARAVCEEPGDEARASPEQVFSSQKRM